MNAPPTTFIRVVPSELRLLLASLLQRLEMPADDAGLIAELMVDTDLRGVFSHGSQTLPGYYPWFLNGLINPRPEIRVLKETPVSVLVDGDGGLGHIAMSRATALAIEKTRTSGLCMAVGRNFGHFGSAGKYVRMAVREGMIAFCVSGMTARQPEDPDTNAWNHYPLDNGPMCFGFPAQDGYPVILDMVSSVMDEWDVDSERFKSIFSQMPAAVFRSFGLRVVVDFLSGALGGMMLPGLRNEDRKWRQAHYGAFLWVLDPATFIDPADFKQEIDRTAGLIRSLQPLPGYDRADLPGGPEWEREQAYTAEGIPVSESHQRHLEKMADELGVAVPWR